jgi:hypothetical protein
MIYCKVCVVFGDEWMEMDEDELKELNADEQFVRLMKEVEAEG